MDSEFWNQKFSIDDYFYGSGPNEFLKETAKVLSPKSKVLCLAEGEGRNSVFLASLGHEVTCVDFSSVGKEKALKLAAQSKVNLDYQLANLVDFKFEDTHWDAIISIFCHLPPFIRPLVHSRVERSLKKDGLFIIEAYTPEQLRYQTGGPKDVTMLYTLEMMKLDFPQLNWEKLEKDERELFEGLGHQGRSVTLRGIGRKK